MDGRDSSGEGWCPDRQHTIEIVSIDIYSFLPLCHDSSHSSRDESSTRTPAADEFPVRLTGI